jgi:hypothetical protein
MRRSGTVRRVSARDPFDTVDDEAKSGSLPDEEQDVVTERDPRYASPRRLRTPV